MLKKSIFFSLILVFICLLSSAVYAANHYVRAGANGSGSDWTNAYSQLPATLVRGDTYYVADGSYPGYAFNDGESGSTYIYVKKATSSDHGTSTGWSNSYGDGQAVFTGELNFTNSYYVIDGQTGGGPGSWETGFGFKVDRSSSSGDAKCVRIAANYITIRHADLENPGEDVSGKADNVYSLGSNHVTISYCWIHATNRTAFLMNGTKNLIIEYSLISERHNTDGTHGELISMNGCGTNANNVIRYNIFRNSGGANTGVIVLKDSVQSGWEIYGNIFYNSDYNRYISSNGIITDSTGDSTTQVKIYNNTFLPHRGLNGNCPTVSWDVSTGNEFINNIVFSSGGFAGVSERDHNLYDNQTYSSQEPHGQYYQDGVNSLITNTSKLDFSLKSSTYPGDSGIGSKYNTDIMGIKRGSDSNWDMGAYEFGGTKTDPVTTPPSTPTGLKISQQ